MAETGRSITLFNSLGRRLEEFVPSEPGKVGIYSCGLTVYAYPHVGNMRAYLFTDTLHRLFEWKGYDIRHIINVTDVGHMTSDADEGDDKMAVAARREQRTMQEVAEYYTGIFLGDLARLRVIPADVFPRASHHVAEMIEFTTALERGGFTYQIDDGLYFDTSLSQGYGRLGLLDLEGMREGARVEAAEGKRNKADFAVWRARRGDEERAMEWPSPWGPTNATEPRCGSPRAGARPWAEFSSSCAGASRSSGSRSMTCGTPCSARTSRSGAPRTS